MRAGTLLAEDPLLAAGKAFVVALCVYEPVALFSRGRLPTVSVLCARYPAVRQALVGALEAHVDSMTRNVRTGR